ncbi:MAG: hypothetical protein ABIH72_00525 [archaeon]
MTNGKKIGVLLITLLIFAGISSLVAADDDIFPKELPIGAFCAPKDTTAPDCNINYLEQKDSHNEYDFDSSSIYLSEDGKFYIYGDAEDSQSSVVNVQWNRTSPDQDYYHIFENAVADDGAFNEKEEEWYSQDWESTFEDGWHYICCRSVDAANNVEIPDEDDCVAFCIDRNNPGIVENVIHSNPSDCVSNYVNEAPEFSWDEAEDEGCAGIDYYEVRVYFSNSTLYYGLETLDTEMSVANPENGEDYYIEVRAVDKAGNKGLWSDKSEDVYYDNENPQVEITGEAWDEWYNDDFSIFEEDSDNLALWKCQIAISGDGSEPDEYMDVECNSEFSVDISEYCPEDGENVCWIRKKVIDNACNENSEGHKWDLDRTPPTTIKTVSDPKYPGFEWMDYLIDWFIKPETTITFSCEDGDGSGCDNTYYRINGGEWEEYDGPFSVGEDDGVYELEYYSEDMIGNEEEPQEEIDKIDTEAPVTSKTYEGPQYSAYRIIPEFDLNVWMRYISGATEIALEAEDSEVGVDKTYVQILVPGGEDHEEWYGQETETWFENELECIEDNCDQEFECQGEVTLECTYFEDNLECSDAGCDWNTEYDCLGSPVGACDGDNQNDCEDTDGCSWEDPITGGCEGVIDCYAIGEDELACNQAGCNWCPDTKCYGSPQQTCAQFVDETLCGNVGCTWTDPIDGGCAGSPVGACDGDNQNDCEDTDGCSWESVGGDCSGEVDIECGDYGEEACEDVPDCAWLPKEVQECPECISTLWQVTDEFEYNTPFTVDETCDHKVCYYSTDLLGNAEDEKCQVFSVDNTAPEIIILNPTEQEAENVEKCIQSVVALVSDDKSGVKSVWAELYDGDDLLRNVSMKKTIYGTYEALMDKQLPAGEYNLIVKAKDNVDNIGEELISEMLIETIFVEYISPAQCQIDPEQGGNCDFTFHICMRGDNSMQMWMNKLGGVVTPDMMNAMISSNGDETFVGLKHDDFESDAGVLMLGNECEEINGRTTFDLSLDLDEDTAGMLGAGAHELEYWLKSSMTCED